MIQETPYGGWKRNLKLQGKETELVITLDVGPRILRYAFPGGKNIMVELSEQLGGSDEKTWQIRGGHRFWTAPEADHSYDLDNTPVTWNKLGESAVEIVQPESKSFGFQKTLVVELLPDETVKLTHRLKNIGSRPLDVTPWALTVMAPGGTAVIPQPPQDVHPTEFPETRQTQPEDFLPNRELVLWAYTNLSDGRYSFSPNFLRITQKNQPATKIGLKLSSGWVAYQNGDLVFAKHLSYDPAQPYPDRGANFELFTNPAILEVESLAPLLPLAVGAIREHVEYWVLRRNVPSLLDESAALNFFQTLPKVA